MPLRVSKYLNSKGFCVILLVCRGISIARPTVEGRSGLKPTTPVIDRFLVDRKLRCGNEQVLARAQSQVDARQFDGPRAQPRPLSPFNFRDA